MTFEVGGGGGDMDDLIWVRIFLYETSGDIIFSSTHNFVRFFPELYAMKDFF